MHIFGLIDAHDKYCFVISNDTGNSMKVDLNKDSFIADIRNVMIERSVAFNVGDYIAVGVDEQSYTGMRILYSFCVGISLATDVQVVDISSLDFNISSSESIRDAAWKKIKNKQFVDLYNLQLNYISRFHSSIG